MTEQLKTLKDCYSVIDGKEELKQEAIKWIKILEKEQSKMDDDSNEELDDELMRFAVQEDIRGWGTFFDYDGTINFIKHFFGIKEEDLL